MSLSETAKDLIFFVGLILSLIVFLTFMLFDTPPFWLKVSLGICMGATCYFAPLARKKG